MRYPATEKLEGEKVRVTSIEPGAVESDLKFTTSGTAAETVLDFY